MTESKNGKQKLTPPPPLALSFSLPSEILLGTDAGDLLTLTFDERDKRERGSAALYTLRDPGGGGGDCWPAGADRGTGEQCRA